MPKSAKVLLATPCMDSQFRSNNHRHWVRQSHLFPFDIYLQLYKLYQRLLPTHYLIIFIPRGNISMNRNLHNSSLRTFSQRKIHNHSINSISTNGSTISNYHRTIQKSVECPKNTSKSTNKRQITIPRAQKRVFNLSEAVEKQRQRELTLIKQSVALLKYYNSLLMLFMMIYTSSQIMATNFFSRRGRCYPQIGVRLVDTLLKVYKNVKQSQLQQKLNRLATNVLKIAPIPSEFQKKAEFISRKVTLNFEKKKEIERAAMNTQISTFWEAISKVVFISTQSTFLEDIFESDAEKLCVKDFQSFLDNYLSTDLFRIEAKDHSSASNNFNVHQFTVQFLLIQKICTKEYGQKGDYDSGQQSQGRDKKKKSYCQIY